MAFEMPRLGQASGENQPLGNDAASSGIGPQPIPRLLAFGIQPQHRTRNAVEQPHPQIEHHRLDLLNLIEATEHKTGFGQTVVGSARAGFSDLLPAVVDLITFG